VEHEQSGDTAAPLPPDASVVVTVASDKHVAGVEALRGVAFGERRSSGSSVPGQRPQSYRLCHGAHAQPP
jgi:hypothetical protein